MEQFPGNLAGVSRHPDSDVVPLDGIAAFLKGQGLGTLSLIPENDRIRCMRYTGAEDICFFVNEGSEVYHGVFEIPEAKDGYWYQPWENCIMASESKENGVVLCLEPGESRIYVLGELADAAILKKSVMEPKECLELIKFTRSFCRAIDYPDMTGHREITLPDRMEEENPEFSGIVSYETTFETHGKECCQLEITDADQCAVEVFLNGKSIGIRAATPCQYDLDGFIEEGINHLVIEAATTAERENAKNMAYGMPYTPVTKSGICGKVFLLRSSM